LGWRRISAVLVGFVGVMLIVQPGTDGFNVFSLSAMLAVLFITGRDLVTRRMGSGMPSLGVAVVTAIGVGAVSLLLSLFQQWGPVDLRAAMFILCSSVFVIGGYVFSIMVMRVGEVAVVAPFRYTGLVFALIFGLLFFAEWPNALALLGAGVVVATGIYTLFRERAVAARERAHLAATRADSPSSAQPCRCRRALLTPQSTPPIPRATWLGCCSASLGPEIQICSGHDPGRLSAPIL
jgi:drug/metabolite transporter (DMT)-like permease